MTYDVPGYSNVLFAGWWRAIRRSCCHRTRVQRPAAAGRNASDRAMRPRLLATRLDATLMSKGRAQGPGSLVARPITPPGRRFDHFGVLLSGGAATCDHYTWRASLRLATKFALML
jgi:hypothetical protein